MQETNRETCELGKDDSEDKDGLALFGFSRNGGPEIYARHLATDWLPQTRRPGARSFFPVNPKISYSHSFDWFILSRNLCKLRAEEILALKSLLQL